METLAFYKENYKNTAVYNDYVYEHFTEQVNATDFLKKHRDYVEEKQAGFGDRAFHFMWYLLLKDLKENKQGIDCLEIGVFKGQVISLWALASQKIGLKANITGISPLEGNYPNNSLFRNYYIRKLLSYAVPSIRRDFRDGNIHIQEDFVGHIDKMFKNSGLDLKEVNLIKGYSNNPDVVKQVADKTFDLVYIDGDHSYKVCKEDLDNYAVLIKPNGYLIMDDAANLIPGTKFFKGIEEVSRATEEIDPKIFKNILNVGHNRIFQKIA
jgi:hypothetical protein